MKAIVCDKCGKVILLPDDPGCFPAGINDLSMRSRFDNKNLDMDLCDECADELVAVLRKGDGGR